MAVVARVEPRKAERRRSGRWRGQRHILNQDLFRDVLTKQRKRADRFNESARLVLVELDVGLTASTASWIWAKAIEALTAATGETAVVGWFQRPSVLGAIVLEPCRTDPAMAVRQELARRLNPIAAGRFSIRSHVCSTDWLETACHAASPFFFQPPPGAGWMVGDWSKRVLDIAGGLTLLLVLSPVFLLIAALLKLTSPGPILFRQTRIGRLAKPFTMLKFRTMRVNADPRLHHEFVTRFIKSSAQLHPAGSQALFKLTNDPRVTALGRILRKTSLDELPQFWNVLRGEMSLVGPRPALPYEVEQYQHWHLRRIIEAKPGITGLWQVGGRSRTTFDEMVRLDLRYARSRSLWTDIKILLATPRAVISGKGAG